MSGFIRRSRSRCQPDAVEATGRLRLATNSEETVAAMGRQATRNARGTSAGTSFAACYAFVDTLQRDRFRVVDRTVDWTMMGMGILVSAAEAGALVDRHERVVRQHIHDGGLPARKDARGRWQIDVEDLARVPGWIVDRERLARLELRQRRSHAGLVSRTEALEARLRGLESHQRSIDEQLARLLELLSPPGAPRPPTPPSPREPEQPSGDEDPELPDPPNDLADLSDLSNMPLAYRGPPTVTLLDRGPDAPQFFRTHADASRWLERHGVSALTPKSWPGWRHVTLTPMEVLRFATERQRAAVAAGNWRVTWRLRRCDDAQCICQDRLDG